MNINDYKNEGMGLSKLAFEKLYSILEGMDECNIIEFGSGISTRFFVDYKLTSKKEII